jgi:hypothetical protein
MERARTSGEIPDDRAAANRTGIHRRGAPTFRPKRAMSVLERACRSHQGCQSHGSSRSRYCHQSSYYEYSSQLREAASIAKAAEVCAETGNVQAAVKMAMDIEEPAHQVDRMLNAALLISNDV